MGRRREWSVRGRCLIACEPLTPRRAAPMTPRPLKLLPFIMATRCAHLSGVDRLLDAAGVPRSVSQLGRSQVRTARIEPVSSVKDGATTLALRGMQDLPNCNQPRSWLAQSLQHCQHGRKCGVVAPRLPRARGVERCRAIRPYRGGRTGRKCPGKRIQGVRTVPRIPAHTNWGRRTCSG
jgi:hypothetical protein